ncbi:hypothetical protein [Streptosporangium sp. G12]
MTASPTLGSILDGLDIPLELNDGDLVSDALVIVKVLRPDGSVSLAITSSHSTSWLDRLGLITAANEIIRSDVSQPCACDDEDD